METISQFSNTVYVQSFYIHVRDEIKDKKKWMQEIPLNSVVKLTVLITTIQNAQYDKLFRGQLEAKPKKKYKLGG